MSNILLEYWYLLPMLILVMIFRVFKPTIKGWFGEKTVALFLPKLPVHKERVCGEG